MPGSASKSRILLVEDDRADARLVSLFLERATRDFELVHVDRLSAALDQLRRGSFDVVLLDLSLPDERGLATVEKILEVNRAMPIVVLSGLKDDRLALRAVEAGAQDYLVKGEGDGELLARTIRYAIQRKQGERQLQDSEERYRHIFETSTDLIQGLHADGSFAFTNPAWRRALGYSEDELKDLSFLDVIHPDHQDHCRAIFGALMEGREVQVLTTELVTRDGRTITVEGNAATHLRDHQPAITFCMFRDVTERLRLERLKNQVISTVSHELRTPLASLRGFVELLLARDYPRDRQREMLSIVHEETVRLSELITDFLDIQKIEAGLQVFNKTAVDLAPVLRESVALFAQEGAPYTLALEIEDELPPVEADVGALKQVLTNLLSNAVKFSPQGGEIRLGARRRDADVELTVRDRGIGMTPETLDRLFDRFFRADDPRARQVRGTGLGLALVKEIVEAHGGHVRAESQYGEGSTFFVRLPSSDTGESPAASRDRDPG